MRSRGRGSSRSQEPVRGTTRDSVTVLGMGNMGSSIATRLLSTGHDVTVWNRTDARAKALGDQGARIAATPAEAVRESPLVITMLSDVTAVRSVLGDAAAGLAPHATVVEMSTIGPAGVRSLATMLPAPVRLIDAPVGGGPAAAAAGQLRLLVGGESSTIDEVEPVLRVLGTIRRCGPLGSGAALKLVNNTALVTGMAALADALAVADALGVPPNDAWDILTAGALSGSAQRARSAGVQFAIELATKDIRLAVDALAGRAAPVARAASDAVSAFPDRRADLSAIV